MARAPRDRPHLHLNGGGESEPYTSPRVVISGLPPARVRATHARQLERAMGQALGEARQLLAGRDDAVAEGERGFYLQFEIPVTYPATAPELELPELDGKTAKMYRGGKICLTIHFKPLWAKNCPRFGIAHALCLGLGPWLAAEIPHLVDTGVIQHKEKQQVQSSS